MPFVVSDFLFNTVYGEMASFVLHCAKTTLKLFSIIVIYFCFHRSNGNVGLDFKQNVVTRTPENSRKVLNSTDEEMY